MLGPTDPTVANPFNPPDPKNPNQRVGISVEDVTSYIALIKEDAGIEHDEEMVQAFNKLADQVHPLALGNVKRSISQSRMMAKKLLALHRDLNIEGESVDAIVDKLTSKLYYHAHPINRQEAKDHVGLPTVEDATPAVEELMWQLYLEYEQEIKMEEPFAFPMEFMAQFPSLQPNQMKVTNSATARLAFIESVQRTDVFSLDYQLAGGLQADGSTNVSLIVRRQGWTTE